MRRVLVILCAVAGCCATAKPVVPVVAPTAACVVPPAPVAIPVVFAECKGFTACLDNANAIALESNLRAQRAWTEEVSLRCGK